MTRRLLVLCASVLPLFTVGGHAGVLPCPTGNPLDVLTGQWTFRIEGINFSAGAAGQFLATIVTGNGKTTRGLLNVVETMNVGGAISRLQSAPGQFQVNSACSGGSLLFNTPNGPSSFDFFFVGACWQKTYFVSTLGLPAVGVGERLFLSDGITASSTVPACSSPTIGTGLLNNAVRPTQ